MFIAEADLNYSWETELAKIPPERYRELRRKLGKVGDELPELQEGLKEFAHKNYSFRQRIMDEVEVDAWVGAGVEVSMKRVRGLASNHPDLHQTIYQIAVPDIGLMQIRRVEQLSECETYSLQRELDRGWRLLAVMPPVVGGGLPSYIVGHTKAED